MGLGLGERVAKIREILGRNRTFESMLLYHYRLMRDTGADDRFEYV